MTSHYACHFEIVFGHIYILGLAIARQRLLATALAGDHSDEVCLLKLSRSFETVYVCHWL